MTQLRLDPFALLSPEPLQAGSANREPEATGFDEHLCRARDEYAAPLERRERAKNEPVTNGDDTAKPTAETASGCEPQSTVAPDDDSQAAEQPPYDQDQNPPSDPSDDQSALAAEAVSTVVGLPLTEIPAESLAGEEPVAQMAPEIVDQSATADSGRQGNLAAEEFAVAGLQMELRNGQESQITQAILPDEVPQAVDPESPVLTVATPQTLDVGNKIVPEVLPSQTLDGLSREPEKAAGKASLADVETAMSEVVQTGVTGDAPQTTQFVSRDGEEPTAERRNGTQHAETEAMAAVDRAASDASALPPTAVADPVSGTTASESDQDNRVQNVTAEQPISTTNSAATTQGEIPPSHGGKVQGSHADASDQQNQVDRAKFVQRVSRAFEALGDRTGTLKLRLSPPELGSLRLEIAMQDGAMTARLEAETAAARNLLLENLPALRERLAQQQIRVERFDVDLMDHRSNGGQADQSSQFSEQRQQPWQRGQSDGANRGGSARELPGAARPRTLTGEGSRLNVVI